jgi:PAS domain-containing protein
LVFFLLLVIVVMVAGGVFIILGIRSFGEDSSLMIEDRTTKIILAQDVARCIQDFLLTWQDYRLTGDPYDYDRLRELAARIDGELEKIKPLVRTPTGRERLDRLSDAWKSCREAVLLGPQNLSSNQSEEVLLSYARDASRAADDFLAWQQRQFLRGNEELRKQVNQAVRWVGMVVFAGVGAVLLLGAFTARSVSAQVLITEMVLSTTRNAVITVDRKGRVTAANQAFEQLLGRPVGSLLHRSYSEVCGEVYPLVEVIKSGKVRQEEITWRTAQGLSTQPDGSGNPGALCCPP